MDDMSSREVVKSLLASVGLPLRLVEAAKLPESSRPVLPSSFRIGTAAQSSIACSALSAAYLHELRTGTTQTVSVDQRHAALEFISEGWTLLNGELPGSPWDPLAGPYPTNKGGYVRIHTNFPHHRDGILAILKCEPTREGIAKALKNWSSVTFEGVAVSWGMCATALRSFTEWDSHPQAKALENTPPVTLIKIGDAPKKSLKPGSSPLTGIRVLDLTRVLAGPICGRTLAAHGADVLWVTSPALPDLPVADIDTSRGKRTTQLNLDVEEDKSTLNRLVKESDVFLHSYRPGSLADRGFGPQAVAASRPGIVYASVNAYGWDGWWKGRRGFDSLVQTATGFNVAEAEAYNAYKGATESTKIPLKAFPVQVLDHAAGQLLAFGINAALAKTITEGGSWEVRVSLAGIGKWLRSLGTVEPVIGFGEAIPPPARSNPQDPEIKALVSEWKRSDGIGGVLIALRHAAVLSETPVRDGTAPLGLAVHPPEFIPLD